METNLFFVYGTLKRGYGNNVILSTSDFVQEDETEESYLLGDIGFPYAFPEHVLSEYFDNDYFLPVRGEVWRVDDPDVVQRLDRLEGEGSHYHRRVTKTKSGAEVYIYEQLHAPYINYCNACEKHEGAWQWT